jgi:hypothetical protein
MPLFKRRIRPAASPAPPEPDNGYRPHVPEPMKALPGIAKLLPIGDIIKGITGVLRDPNGKISSKRAGAGAFTVASITFLGAGDRFSGIACMVGAIVLFALTKWEGSGPERL